MLRSAGCCALLLFLFIYLPAVMRSKLPRPALLSASTVLVAMLAGCATNPYHDYYQAEKIPEYEKRNLRYLPEDGTPKLTSSTGNPKAELEEALSHGFVVIGTATFNAPMVSAEELAEQAKDVGATHVLYSAKLAGKVTGFAPQAMTKEQAKALSKHTTHHQDSEAAAEPVAEQDGEQAEKKDELFWGMGYLPVSFNKQRYDQSATFLVKSAKQPVLGLDTQSLTSDQKNRLGFNRGVVVKRVFYDSPGFDADLRKGDILYSVNGIVIENERHFRTIARSYANAGRTMQFEIVRGEEPMSVTLNPQARGHRTAPVLVEQSNPAEKAVTEAEEKPSTEVQTDENAKKDEALKTPEEKQAEAAERWAKRKKAYDERIKKKQARAKDGLFMGMFHSVTDWFDSDE